MAQKTASKPQIARPKRTQVAREVYDFPKAHIIEKGEIVFYKSMDGNYGLYKVLNADIDFSGLTIKVESMPYDGKDARKGTFDKTPTKKFDTTLENKNGEPRIFRTWLQIGDYVTINGEKTDNIAKVIDMYPTEMIKAGKKDYQNVVELVTVSKTRQFVFELSKEAPEKCTLIDIRECEAFIDDDLPF